MNEARRAGITDTSFRDAHQSLLATRMRLDEMLPIAELMDQVGFHSMEVWGGATFDACMRFLDEDPWERLRKLRRAIKKTKLQMLLRGQNIVGYSAGKTLSDTATMPTMWLPNLSSVPWRAALILSAFSML